MSPTIPAHTNGHTTNGNGFAAPNGHTNGHANGKPPTDGFGTRAIHVGAEPSAETGAVIPAMDLSTTYVQSAPGQHKVRYLLFPLPMRHLGRGTRSPVRL